MLTAEQRTPLVASDKGETVATLGPDKKVPLDQSRQVYYNAADYGIVANNSTSFAAGNGDKLRALIASIPDPSDVGSGAVIVMPPGTTLLAGSFVLSKRMVVQGHGRTNTTLKRPAGSTGDFFTFNAAYSGIRDLTLEGGRYQNTGTLGMDNLVINSSYFAGTDFASSKATGRGIVIGKAATAIAVNLMNVQTRENRGYDIETVAGSGSTDGQWAHLDLAYAGKSSVYLGVGAQNITDIHIWSSGLEEPTDSAGIILMSSGNTIINLQSEKNLGYGAAVFASGNKIVGGAIWGNVKEGVLGSGANNCTLEGVQIYRNCVSNTTGVSSTAFAAIRLVNCQRWRIMVDVWDNNSAMTGSMPVTAPTHPYPGKQAALGHAYAVIEEGATDYINYSGSTMPKIYTTGSSTGSPVIIVGHNASFDGCDLLTVATQAATAVSGTVRVPSYCEAISVNAGTAITAIAGHKIGKVRQVTILFTGSGSQTITSTANLKLAGGSFPAAPGAVLGLRSIGDSTTAASVWYETFRQTV
ncbi:hypothetical protein EDF22_0664 [Rathayibacter sp. PhB127]|uniref:glycosyl hydrolase family 28-related protein n=1 Tax=Rathayibacter sp. PhB127 TaxID=2485176 RepID=UPI000F4BB57B|nr:glycosyl hydrolase family 28-related protein [Rathayibacter sp. PhB127]ROS28932.1 hypothetical protein EDF22_0664 [Rathayibacter sp. PhB127]